MYINTLSELAHHVPLTQIDIPPAAYQYVLHAPMPSIDISYTQSERT